MNRNKKHMGDGPQTLVSLEPRDFIWAFTVSILTLGVYAYTAAPGVTMEDSGDFIIGVLTLGIVHQPGYPLYTMLGHLFSYLPIGDPAFRVNLFSALWGALCLGVMFLNFRILSISSLYAAFAALNLGFTTIFWSKTAVAEVYSFNGFLLAMIVFWILSYNRDQKKWQFYLVGFTTGLSLSNHYPLTILAGVGLIFLLDRRALNTKDLLRGFMVLLLGLTPYLYLFVQAYNPDLVYNFGKVSDAGMVLDHIQRKYSSEGPGGTGFDKVLLSFWFLKTLIMSFLLGSFFLIAGILLGFMEKWPYRYPFLIASLGPSLGLVLVLPIPNDPLMHSYLADFAVPTVMSLSVFLAFGIKSLTQRFFHHKGMQLTLLTIFLLFQTVYHFPHSSHHNDRLAETWGAELLNSLKPNAILILCASSQFHLYYLQLIKGVRKDATIYDRFSLWTKDNLFAPELLFKMQGNQIEYQKTRERELIANSTRPIYYTCKNVPEELNIPYTYTPYLIRVDRKHSEAGDATKFSVSEKILNSLADDYPKSEYWLDLRRKLIFSRLISYFGGHGKPGADKVINFLKETKFYTDSSFVLSLANDLYFYENYDLAKFFYERAEHLSADSFGPTDLAVYCSLLGNARDYDHALAICMRQEQTSVPCEVNTINTRQTIAAIYKEKGQWSDVARYSRRILECQPDHFVARSYLALAVKKTEARQTTTELIATDESQ